MVAVNVSVLVFNTFLIPSKLPSSSSKQYLTERTHSIAKEINKGEFDLYLLVEVWLKILYKVFVENAPSGYYITRYEDLTTCKQDRWASFSPAFCFLYDCSGLLVISKFPFQKKQVFFQKYSDSGSKSRALQDGEYLAGKGWGVVQIQPIKGLLIDVYITHTIADFGFEPNYVHNREKQIYELSAHLNESDADIVLLGGDFNIPSPWSYVKNLTKSFLSVKNMETWKYEKSFKYLEDAGMKNVLDDVPGSETWYNGSNIAALATFGAGHNTFSASLK